MLKEPSSSVSTVTTLAGVGPALGLKVKVMVPSGEGWMGAALGAGLSFAAGESAAGTGSSVTEAMRAGRRESPR
jgi:hypothetical protein